MVCPPATSEAEARWPRFGLVVIATYSRRDNKHQMIKYQVQLAGGGVTGGTAGWVFVAHAGPV
jgi:hypothetical protein